MKTIYDRVGFLRYPYVTVQTQERVLRGELVDALLALVFVLALVLGAICGALKGWVA